MRIAMNSPIKSADKPIHISMSTGEKGGPKPGDIIMTDLSIIHVVSEDLFKKLVRLSGGSKHVKTYSLISPKDV